MKKLINAPSDVRAGEPGGLSPRRTAGALIAYEPGPVRSSGARRRPCVGQGRPGLRRRQRARSAARAASCGPGTLDAACPGPTFTSPGPDQPQAAAKAVDAGAGVLFIVKNYSGDVMNFEMAAEMHEGESATVLVNDDVAVEDSSFTSGRRGVAGTAPVEKVARRRRRRRARTSPP
ncbi:MAG: dihydroxyacetone kinase subunit DhaK [Xanthomonadales bacterium]|nr:dihydroxyacetone kinase subunit DhaK [Xanthomonadales bacterium]